MKVGSEMKFVFDYEETLSRRIAIESDNLGDALNELRNRIDKAMIVLDASDFMTGKISLPLEKNSPYFIRVERDGEPVKDVEGLDIVLEEW